MPDSHFVTKLFLLLPLLFHVLFSLLLVDLVEERLFHRSLLLLLLVSYKLLVVTALPDDVALAFKLKINSILKHTTSRFDIRKVLLCN
jgi:hypothetical protein